MHELTISERDNLVRALVRRKQAMRDEIRAGLAGMRGEAHENHLSGTPDAGDESPTTLITNVTKRTWCTMLRIAVSAASDPAVAFNIDPAQCRDECST